MSGTISSRLKNCITALLILGSIVIANAFSTNGPTKTSIHLKQELQKCCHEKSPAHTMLSRVGEHLSPKVDPDGSVSSLVLVRLSKRLLARSNIIWLNQYRTKTREKSQSKVCNFGSWEENLGPRGDSILMSVCSTLAQAIEESDGRDKVIEAGVEGIKAAAIISRLLQTNCNEDNERKSFREIFGPLSQNFASFKDVSFFREHHLSGLKWAHDSLALADDAYFRLSEPLLQAYREADIPFRIRPGFLFPTDLYQTTLFQYLSLQVQFRTDFIKTTTTNEQVKERRMTAWQGDNIGLPHFVYSGKQMETEPMSPVVRALRDLFKNETGISYDCCLLNLYPNGDSGMRYHADPDQGTLWTHDTAVLSVGAARKFAFRTTVNKHGMPPEDGIPHSFVMMNGDVVEMFADCQDRYQHAIKPAQWSSQTEQTPRISLVFKNSFVK